MENDLLYNRLYNYKLEGARRVIFVIGINTGTDSYQCQERKNLHKNYQKYTKYELMSFEVSTQESLITKQDTHYKSL